MAFWCRIRQTKLISLSNQFKRCYLRIPGPRLVDQTASIPRIWVVEKPISGIHSNQTKVVNNVRFFAAPVQAKPKQEEKDASGPRLNDQITADVIRLVTEEGHSVLSRSEAMERARRLNLDLVEVQRHAKPPVCKLMDYHKEKYKQQVKEKDRAKSKSQLTLRKGDFKEVRFSGKTEQKDLQMKANMVKRLMERGYRVKCMAMGTEDQDLGGLLSRISALIEDFSIVESGPRVEKKQAYVIVRHIKFGPPKKGVAKKASKVATSPQTVNPAMLSQSSIQSDKILDPGSESDGEILSEEETPDKNFDKKNHTWSALDENDDFDDVFDVRDVVKVGDVQTKPVANSFSDFSRGPVVNSGRRETFPSSPSEPRNKYRPEKSMDGKGTGYGIFSAPTVKDTLDKNGLPAEVNRYQKGNTFDSTRHSRPRGVSANPNAPSSNTDRGGRPGFENGGQGKWGIFSGESSNVIPTRDSESQAKVQR